MWSKKTSGQRDCVFKRRIITNYNRPRHRAGFFIDDPFGKLRPSTLRLRLEEVIVRTSAELSRSIISNYEYD